MPFLCLLLRPEASAWLKHEAGKYLDPNKDTQHNRPTPLERAQKAIILHALRLQERLIPVLRCYQPASEVLQEQAPEPSTAVADPFKNGSCLGSKDHANMRILQSRMSGIHHIMCLRART